MQNNFNRELCKDCPRKLEKQQQMLEVCDSISEAVYEVLTFCEDCWNSQNCLLRNAKEE